jgi:uncharacterized protein with ATP-grasp and redox domains
MYNSPAIKNTGLPSVSYEVKKFMPNPLRPSLEIPEPTRGLQDNSWAQHSITVRLREIAARTLADNNYSPEIRTQFEALIDEIPTGKIRQISMPLAPHAQTRRGYFTPYVGQTWLEVPWFFAEYYFYQRVLEASGYYQDGPGRGLDPFAVQKRLGLETAHIAVHTLAAWLNSALRHPQHTSHYLVELIAIDLWANQIDLSLWPVEEGDSTHHDITQTRTDHVLVDDTQAAAAHLLGSSANPGRVDFLIDNAGFELVCDLCLADFLLSGNLANEIRFHVKAEPTFVSDAVPKDVRQTIQALAADADADTQQLGARLIDYLGSQRLTLREDFFWTSPLAMWEMPPSLHEELESSRLVITKGDANYRRLLGDRLWPYTTPFAGIVSYFPAPLLALRTLKAELASGLQPDVIARTAQADPDWLTDGQWGLIQFAG